jgi:hypothetical protein
MGLWGVLVGMVGMLWGVFQSMVLVSRKELLLLLDVLTYPIYTNTHLLHPSKQTFTSKYNN